MKKKALLLIVFAAFFLFLLSACSKIDSPLVGNWEYVTGTDIYYFAMNGLNGDIEFKENGRTMEHANDQAGKFELDGDRRFTVRGNNERVTYHYTYTLHGNTLTLTDHEDDSATWRRAGSSVNTNPDASALVGRWEVLSGTRIYYFALNMHGDIEFFADGTVMEYAENEPGTFTMGNGRLSVYAGWDGMTYDFTVELFENTLTIIDRDGDSVIYVRR